MSKQDKDLKDNREMNAQSFKVILEFVDRRGRQYCAVLPKTQGLISLVSRLTVSWKNYGWDRTQEGEQQPWDGKGFYQ